MKKKNIIFAIIIVLVVLFLIIVLALNNKNSQNSTQRTTAKNSINNKKTAQTAQTAQTDQTAQTSGLDSGNPEEVIVPPIPVNLSLMPGSPEAPKQEKVAVKDIPAKAIKLEVSDQGFSPKEFTINPGQPVSLAITAVGSNTHVFLFPNASLMALTVMISSGETKVINFTAPAAGSYPFRDDIPSFRANTGTMIVK